MGVQRESTDAVSQLVSMRRQVEELKTRQPIGSNQIVMYPQESSSTWDVTLQAKYAGQYSGSPGWNVAIVTAEAVDSDNLVADMVPTFSISMPLGGGWINIPQPASESGRMQWFVPIFATYNSWVSIKVQVVANTPVTITAEEFTP